MAALMRSLLCWLLLPLLFLLALYSVAGRLALLVVLPKQQHALVEQINARYGVNLTLASLRGQWSRLDPIIQLRGVQLGNAGNPWLQVAELDLQLDVWASLINGLPVVDRLYVGGVTLTLPRDTNGQWRLPDALISAPDRSSPVDSTATPTDNRPVQRDLQPLLAGLFLQRSVTLENLRLVDQQVPGETLLQGAFEWRNQQRQQRLRLRLSDQRGDLLQLLGQGRGLPGYPEFRFDYHLSPSREGLSRLSTLAGSEGVFAGYIEAWGAVEGASHRLQGMVTDAQLQLPSVDLALTDLRSHVRLQQEGDAWQLDLSGLRGTLEESLLPIDALRLSGRGNQLEQLNVSELQMAALWELFLALPHALLPEGLQARLAPLAPQGALHNVMLNWATPGDWQSFRLIADLEKVSVAAWQGAPALAGVDGRLETTQDTGRIDLDSSRFALDFPELYQQGWHFAQAEGVVEWHQRPEGVEVESQLLSLSNAQVRANGRFRLEIPRFDYRQRGGRLVLMIGMHDSSVESAPLFVPDRIVDPALFGWLRGALRGGALATGGLVYDAPLLSEAQSASPFNLQLFFDARKAMINYQAGWPAVADADAVALIKNGAVLVQTRRGRVYEKTRVAQAEVSIGAGSHLLNVQARLEGPAADGRLALLESPIGASLGEEFARWEVGGDLHTALDLAIDLDRPEASTIRVETGVHNGSYASEILKLHISDIHGGVHFDSGYGLWSTPLSGVLFDRPVEVQIQTEQSDKGRVTLLQGEGRVALTDVRGWTGLALFDAFVGETDYRFELSLCGDEPGCSSLQLESPLQGVRVNAPAPFAKSAEATTPLRLQLSLTPGTQWLHITYPQLEGQFALQAGALKGGRLALGGASLPAQLHAEGVVVEGVLDSMDGVAWRGFVEQHLLPGEAATGSSARSDSPLLKQVRLQARSVDYDGWRLDNLQSQLRYNRDHWQVDLSSDLLGGSLIWPATQEEPIVVQLQHLRLPAAMEESEGETDGASQVSAADALHPAHLPALDLTIDALSRGDQLIGDLGLRLRPLTDGVAIERLTGNLYGLATEAQGSWVRELAGDTTRLAFKAKTSDFGQVMSRLGSARTLETRRTRLDGELRWQGAVNRIDWPSLAGQLDLSAKEGRLLDTGDQPVLKLFSLFNANTLLRRLKLDFSDLAKSGTSFDTLDARLHIDQGVAQTDGAAKLRGPQMDIDMEGQVDLAGESLDVALLAQLPISANLPIAAAVVATPAVAGAVFLIERLIGKQLKRFTSVRYRLHGSWANPKMELDRSTPAGTTETMSAGDR